MGFRFDTGSLGKVTRTPQGGIRVDAALTRSGVLTYSKLDGSPVYEWRPADEVFKADSMRTLEGAPVTRRHPDEMVRADNFGSLARGHVGENVRQDGDKLAATVFIQDAELIADVEAGAMREISCGYYCDHVDKPGVVPDGQPDAGKRYDRVQTNIRYNHAAVLERGRAGSDVGLRLDASDDLIPPPVEGRKDTAMKIERIDGVDYEIGTPAHAAAVSRRDAAEASRVKDAAELKAAADALRARADAAEADKKKLEAELAAAKDPARMDAALQAREELRGGARKVLGADFKFDGLDEASIRKAVVAKAYPDFKLDGEPEAYVRGLFKAALAKGEESDPVLDAEDRALADLQVGADTAKRTDSISEYARAIEESEKSGRSMWLPKDQA